jgi:hypothetical protein
LTLYDMRASEVRDAHPIPDAVPVYRLGAWALIEGTRLLDHAKVREFAATLTPGSLAVIDDYWRDWVRDTTTPKRQRVWADLANACDLIRYHRPNSQVGIYDCAPSRGSATRAWMFDQGVKGGVKGIDRWDAWRQEWLEQGNIINDAVDFLMPSCYAMHRNTAEQASTYIERMMYAANEAGYTMSFIPVIPAFWSREHANAKTNNAPVPLESWRAMLGAANTADGLAIFHPGPGKGGTVSDVVTQDDIERWEMLGN